MTEVGRENEPIEAPFLTEELRKAFAEAAGDEGLWGQATENAERYLESRGVPLSDAFSVAFLEAEREGDMVRYLGAGGLTLFEVFCPPQRVWWTFCRKLMRVCEKRTVIINGEPKEIETNCYFVCEEWIWEQAFTLPTRPPFPPFPLLGPI